MSRIRSRLVRACATGMLAVAASWAHTQAVAMPVLQINDVSQLEGDSGTTQFVFTMSLSSGAPVGGVSFDIATGDDSAIAGLDYVAKSLTFQTIAAGEMSYTFTVDVLGDILVESPYERFWVSITNVVNGLVGDSVGEGFIQNDDVARSVPEPASLALALAGLTLLATGRAHAARRRARPLGAAPAP